MMEHLSEPDAEAAAIIAAIRRRRQRELEESAGRVAAASSARSDGSIKADGQAEGTEPNPPAVTTPAACSPDHAVESDGQAEGTEPNPPAVTTPAADGAAGAGAATGKSQPAETDKAWREELNAPPPQTDDRRAATRESGDRRGAARADPRGYHNLKATWRRLSDLMRRDPNDPMAPPKLAPSIVLGSVVINVLGLALPLVLLQVYDRVLPNESTSTLLVLMMILIGVTILDALLKIARAYLVGSNSSRHQMSLSTDAVHRILHAPPSIVSKERVSVYIERLDSLNSLREFYGGNLHMLMIDLPFVFVYLGIIAIIAGWLAVVPLVLFTLFAVRIVLVSRVLRKVWDDRSSQASRKYDFIMECLTAISTIKALAMEPFMQRRYERLKRYSAQSGYRAIYFANKAQNTAYLFSNFSLVSLVSIGAIMAINGYLTVGSLAACVLLNGRAIQPLTRGLALYAQVQQLYSARQRARELFKLPTPQKVQPLVREEIEGTVVLSNVSFAYTEEQPLFKNLDLSVGSGEIVGIRAHDGSGKSTLMKLITGELEPDKGNIRIADVDMSAPKSASVRPLIAYVPPQQRALRGTILENISMFKGGAAADDARRAARILGLESDIFHLRNGYETELGSGAVEELPTGFMQRIMIARALAHRPAILLLDESNSSFDSRSDRLMREGLNLLRGHMTIIIVNQRPSLLRIADAVFDLKQGQLLRVPPEDLRPPQAKKQNVDGQAA